MYIKKSKIPKKYRDETLEENEETENANFEEGSIEESSDSSPNGKIKQKKLKPIKEKREKKQLSKKTKVAFSVFVGVVVVAVSVALAVTFWPVNLNGLYSQFNTLSSKTFEEDESNMTTFVDYYYTVRPTLLANADYRKELDSFINFAKTQQISFSAFNQVLSMSLTKKVENIKVNSMIKNLENANQEMEKISNYINKHKSTLTNSSTIMVSWGNVRIYYKAAVEELKEFYINFDEVMQTAELQGIFGNDFLRLSVQGCKEYFCSFADNLFLGESISADKSAVVLSNYKKFVKSYFEGDNLNIVKHYDFNDGLQQDFEQVILFEKNTEGKVSFMYLIENDFDYSGLSSKDQQLAQEVEEFLKGELD